MKILEQRALRGPNRYSRRPCIFMPLDIGVLEESPSNKLPGFTDRLLALIPTLKEHGCSVGKPGGFVQRLNQGTWVGHIVEHVALELQCLAGMEVGFGKIFDTPKIGIYNVVYRYIVESAGLYAGIQAVELVAAVIEGEYFDIDLVIFELKQMREKDMLGPSTASIVEEAKRRGIPTIRLNESSFVQLGYGVNQRLIQATITDQTSALGVEIADEKYRTKELLKRAGIKVPSGEIVKTLDETRRIAQDIGYPLAVKPNSANHGKGITTAISTLKDLEQAYNSAKDTDSEVVIEHSLVGNDYRVLVINGTLEAAALREPAYIVGDGKLSIQSLIDEVNKDPRRGIGHEKVLTIITVDKMTKRLLLQSNYSLDDVLPKGEKLYLKSTANLSTGGTATDVTDDVHADVRHMCERIAQIVGLDCIGIDIVAHTLTSPLNDSSGVVEVNAAPGFRMHLEPTVGKKRNVAKPFVDMLFPNNRDFEVPIIAVTGTNGKTTTTRLIAHTLKYAGRTVGLAGTNGVEIDGVSIVSGDYSGPEGAEMIFRDKTIDHAVIEVARGGIIRRGLGFSHCNVGVLLNIEDDHLGNDGIEGIDDLALVKSSVVEVVKESGTAVLNADDPHVSGLTNRARGNIIYFSMQTDNEIVTKHVNDGGTAVVLENNTVVIKSLEPDVNVLNVIDAPITLRGVVSFNIANVMAAVAALHGLGLSVEIIRTGIGTFHPSATQNPGRMNIIDFLRFKVVVDYAHNVPAVKALGKVLPQIAVGRKIIVAHGSGSRVDKAIQEFGSALSNVFDHIIVTDADPRNRPLGQTPELVLKGAIDSGFSACKIEIVIDPFEAIDRAFEIVGPGELIVVQVDEVKPMLDQVLKHFKKVVGKTEISESRPAS